MAIRGRPFKSLPDLTGNRFGQLMALRRHKKTPRQGWEYECQCDCGKIHVAVGYSLSSGNTVSCGCHRAKVFNHFIHGLSKTPLHSLWNGMVFRCSKQSTKRKYYFDRGIAVCERWRCFENFLADMGSTWAPGMGLTIERIDNDGNYEPSNCRWATQREQARNTRNCRPITHASETHLLRDWAKMIGVSEATLCKRLKRGWTIAQALGREPQPSRRRAA